MMWRALLVSPYPVARSAITASATCSEGLMNSDRHVIKRISDPRFLS